MKWKRLLRIILPPSVLALLIVSLTISIRGNRFEISGFEPMNVLEHVEILSSDEMAGRAAGSPGNRRAVDYVISRFREYGIAPSGSEGQYEQVFPS